MAVILVPGLEPVAIALCSVDAGDAVRLHGIDLNSGAYVSVTIDRTSDAETQCLAPPLAGLVLTISIASLEQAD